MGGAVFERALQLQHDLAGAVTLEPFVGNRRAGDIAAQVFEFFALMGATAYCRMQTKAVRVDAAPAWTACLRLGTLCRLSTFCPARGPSAMR